MSVLFYRGAGSVLVPAGTGSGGTTPPPGGGTNGPGPGTSTIPTYWSQTLPNSFGVNLHPLKSGTAYNSFTSSFTSPGDQMAWAINYVGATHVRDVIAVGNTAQRAVHKQMFAQTGATILFCGGNLYGGATTPTGGAVASEILNNYVVNGSLIVDAVSGLNESDISGNTNQVSITTTFQSQLWASALNGQVTILGPSMGSDTSTYSAYGNLSGVCNIGDLHTYPGGYVPSNRIGVHYTNSRNMYGPSMHVWTTEGGYENAINYRGGNPPVPENVTQYYGPRIILEHFIYPGDDRFYRYELVDERADAALTNRESNFGMFRNDWSPKPEAVAVARMMNLTEDPGTVYTPPSSISGSVTGGDSKTKFFNLQKRDGTNLLFVWRDVSLGTPSTTSAFTPATVSPITVTLNLPYATTVNHYEPSTNTSTGNTTPTPVRTTAGTAHATPVSGGVVVLSWQPASAPVVATQTNVLGSTGSRSGLKFNLGMWPYRTAGTAANYTSAQQYQETRMGRQVDIQMAAQYNNGSWGDLTGLQILDFLDNYPGPLPVLMLPPWIPTGSWASAASGAYDTYYQQIGAAIASKRPGQKTAIRFAWESNGSNWYPWQIDLISGSTATQIATFQAGWQRAVSQIRSGAGAQASNIVWVYSLSGLDDYGPGYTGLDPLTDTYPGDAYVDVVGIDYYDWNPATTDDNTPGQVDKLNRILAFVQAHGKQMSIDEFGLHHTGASGEGGDNPHFIRAMIRWVKANAVWVAWANYFQDDDPSNVNSGLFSPTVNNNPNSTAAWLAEIGL